MDNTGYIIDGNYAAIFFANHIYNPIKAIVENAANFYDADGTIVSIFFKDYIEIDGIMYITELIFKGNGKGFSYQELKDLNEIGNSKKRESVFTNGFKRAKLGYFGMSLTSFQILGKEIEIYSKPNANEQLFRKIVINEDNTPTFSEIEISYKDKEYGYFNNNKVFYETGCTILIKNCKIPISIFSFPNEDKPYFALENELSYLPIIMNNFKIELEGEEIKRRAFNVCANYRSNFEFEIDNIHFTCKLVLTEVIGNHYYRGVYLIVDGRIIKWNIMDLIKNLIPSLGGIEDRIQGYIYADELRYKLNASRDGLTDLNLSLLIANKLKKGIYDIKKKKLEPNRNFRLKLKIKEKSREINSIVKEEFSDLVDFTLNENNRDNNNANNICVKSTQFIEELNKIEETKERLRNPNKYLSNLGVEFCWTPKDESEVIVIASQLCQLKLLDFDLVELSTSGTDAIIAKNKELFFLEFEKTLSNFFMHKHNNKNIGYILCWDANLKDCKKECNKYIKIFDQYIENLNINIDRDEILVTNCDGTEHIIKLYILSKIIKNLCG